MQTDINHRHDFLFFIKATKKSLGSVSSSSLSAQWKTIDHGSSRFLWRPGWSSTSFLHSHVLFTLFPVFCLFQRYYKGKHCSKPQKERNPTDFQGSSRNRSCTNNRGDKIDHLKDESSRLKSIGILLVLKQSPFLFIVNPLPVGIFNVSFNCEKTLVNVP